MTLLNRKLKRVTTTTLDGSFGRDKFKRIVITLLPGNGRDTVDLISFRPERSRRAEQIAVMDCYRYALRCRVARSQLEKAREKKAKKAERLARNRREYAEKRLTQP